MKDTITPLNYTKEAIKDLSVMEKGLRSNAPLTSYIMRQVIDMLDSSVKFILPNCCDIIEPEEYRQTHFDLARLPYPVVTFEIPWFKDNVETQLIYHHHPEELLCAGRPDRVLNPSRDVIQSLTLILMAECLSFLFHGLMI